MKAINITMVNGVCHYFTGPSGDVNTLLNKIRNERIKAVNFNDANKKVDVIIFVDKIISIEVKEGGVA